MKITVGQLVGIIVLILIIGAGAYVGASQIKNNKGGKERQAVFLSNGQVYFGQVSRPDAKTVIMRDVYYLQVQQPLQQTDKKEQEQPQVSLVKLGNELHGPKDEMRINRDHILFIEDMKDDSKVNQTIADYIKNGATQASPTPQPSP